ncbi:MAG: hypothetical protein WCJ55_09510 [Chloroflexales bacterium]
MPPTIHRRWHRLALPLLLALALLVPMVSPARPVAAAATAQARQLKNINTQWALTRSSPTVS